MVWRCGDKVLTSSSKYQLKQEGTVVELVIYKLQGTDAGEYSCDTGSQRTTAVLTVHGRLFHFISVHAHAGLPACTFLSVITSSDLTIFSQNYT